MATARLEAFLGLNTKSFEKGLAQARAKATEFAETGLKAIGAAALSAGAALAIGTRKIIGAGAELHHLSGQTGVTSGDLSVLMRAFEDSGIAADQVGASVNKLQKALVDAGKGSAEFLGAFNDMGVSVEGLLALGPAQQFGAVADALGRMQDPARQAAASMKVFGESGAQLLPLFKGGGALSDAATALGGLPEIMNDFSASFERIDTLLDRLPSKSDQFFAGFAGGVVGSIIGPLEQANEIDFTPLGAKLGAAVAPILEGVKDGSTFEIIALQLNKSALGFGARLAEGVVDVAKTIPRVLGAAVAGAGDMLGTAATNHIKSGLRVLSKLPGFKGLADKIPANESMPSMGGGMLDSLADTGIGRYMRDAGNDIFAGAVAGMARPGASPSSILDAAFDSRIDRLQEANTSAAYRNQAVARLMQSGGGSMDGEARGSAVGLLKSIDDRLAALTGAVTIHP